MTRQQYIYYLSHPDFKFIPIFRNLLQFNRDTDVYIFNTCRKLQYRHFVKIMKCIRNIFFFTESFVGTNFNINSFFCSFSISSNIKLKNPELISFYTSTIKSTISCCFWSVGNIVICSLLLKVKVYMLSTSIGLFWSPLHPLAKACKPLSWNLPRDITKSANSWCWDLLGPSPLPIKILSFSPVFLSSGYRPLITNFASDANLIMSNLGISHGIVGQDQGTSGSHSKCSHGFCPVVYNKINIRCCLLKYRLYNTYHYILRRHKRLTQSHTSRH